MNIVITPEARKHILRKNSDHAITLALAKRFGGA
jgi:hypothetical protein